MSGQTDPKTPLDADLPEEPKHCIALLDDNDDIRFVLRTMLERDYIVKDFDNAAGLLEFLEEKPCDLILSDLSLPNMDGFDFMAALRKDRRLAAIPVVALTASGSDETRQRAVAAGFTAYLLKPAPMVRLLSVIAQNLRRLAI